MKMARRQDEGLLYLLTPHPDRSIPGRDSCRSTPLAPPPLGSATEGAATCSCPTPR